MPNPVSRRTALRYNRLRDLIGVLANALLDQPNAAGSPATVVMINDMFALARHVFARLAGMPRFDPLSETAALSTFVMRLVVMRLHVACAAFDRQYGNEEIIEPEAPDAIDDPYEGYDPAEVERFLAEDDTPPQHATRRAPPGQPPPPRHHHLPHPHHASPSGATRGLFTLERWQVQHPRVRPEGDGGGGGRALAAR